jgi:hypothetical protein
MARLKKCIDESTQSRMANGTVTKALFVKNFAVSDWQLLEQVMAANGLKKVREGVSFCVRKASGVI